MLRDEVEIRRLLAIKIARKAVLANKDDSPYLRLSDTFNMLAWGDSEPDADEYSEAREKLNELISRDFPELSDSDLFELRDEIIEGIEKVKRILGIT